jgi:hypothetical protein
MEDQEKKATPERDVMVFNNEIYSPDSLNIFRLTEPKTHLHFIGWSLFFLVIR